jgi:hypothetical protein
MENLKKSEAACLKAINEMCDVLAKAMPMSGMMAGVKPTRNVPDYTPEQIAQARGSNEPMMSEPEQEVPAQEFPAEAQSSDMPGIEPEVASDLSQYTPEKLQEIVSHISKHLADHFAEAIMKRQLGSQERQEPQQGMASKVREQGNY